jgi:antirestriction protein
MPGAEKWAIHDYEGFGLPLHLSKSETFERISVLASGVVAARRSRIANTLFQKRRIGEDTAE